MQLHKQQPTKGYDSLALQASEQARARSLLEILNEANVDMTLKTIRRTAFLWLLYRVQCGDICSRLISLSGQCSRRLSVLFPARATGCVPSPMIFPTAFCVHRVVT